jgi:leader peptidase (prepilin peptidase)/N-methyltransferase
MIHPQILQLLFVFVMGLMAGSFLNVCIYRLPTGDFFSSSRSFCPRCRKPIAWYDNIPLLSYAALGGKCRQCAEPISTVYPLVELLSGILFAGFYWRFLLGGSGAGVYVVYVVVGAALIVSTFIDLKLRIIPNEITITGVLLAPFASIAVPALHDGPLFLARYLPAGALSDQVLLRADAFLASVFSILIGGGSIYMLGVIGKIAFKKDAMGGGDVKLMAMLGGLLGWKAALATFFLAPFIAISFGVYSLIRTKDHVIPYGPFLSAAALGVMIWRQPLFQWIAAHLFPA